MRLARRFLFLIPALLLFVVGARTDARQDSNTPAATRIPSATLSRSTPYLLTGRVDSNSPAVWDRVDGEERLHVFTSFDGYPSRATGTNWQRLGAARPVTLSGFEGGGYWLEAVVQDIDGTLYGYYHNERPATACRDAARMIPRIGAARSTDGGETWENLGILLESSRVTLDCSTVNKYFVGGVGDLSVMLDPDSKDLYIFYSEYSRDLASQGVGVARLLWADRDDPEGKVTVWRSGLWQPAREIRQMQADGSTSIRHFYPSATPLHPTTDSWHDGNGSTDAFWGPSVHWNTYLERYVMLLNRAKNALFDTEGIYVSFSPALDDPALWSTPQRILNGGAWYPQVIGLEAGSGSDKVAGEWARFFLAGRSDYIIRFSK
jgi:hypothetical protein